MQVALPSIDPSILALNEHIKQTAIALNVECYMVGGFVRNLFLNKPSKDIDYVVVGSGIQFAEALSKKLAGKVTVSYFKNFGTASIKYNGLEIEFVGARKESYLRDSRKPIVENGTLADDMARRDFTINAMAIAVWPNPNAFIDPYDGLKDLEKGIIRTPLSPEITFSDDPLRMLRAVRFQSQLQFQIEENTLKGLMAQTERINIISKERISDEFNKILCSPLPSLGLNSLFITGLMHHFFPEMVALHGVKVINNLSHKDNFYHTLKVVDNISATTNDLWTRWAALLHDIAKPPTQKFDPVQGWTFHGHEELGAKMVPGIFKNLRLPLNEKMKFVQKLVRLHLRPIALTKTNVTDSAVRRLLFDAGNDIDALMQLCKADITSSNDIKVKKYLNNFNILEKKLKEVESKDRLRNWQPPLTGEDIKSMFNIEEGRLIGKIKNALRESILEGETENNYESAYQYVTKVGTAFGLQLHSNTK